ncbi:hypothetical protein [Streptomyces sp. NBC_01527]|uniref:hypothetical protein n=1 Tax=Streptomyces sp. NBC_01527 TaxID=2903894 RepID=UPI0038702335
MLTATRALAAVTMGPKGTLSAAVLALAVSVTTATYNHAWGTQQVYTNFLAILVVSVASVMTSRAIATRRSIELDQVRRIAVAAQEVILRPVPAQLGPVRRPACVWRLRPEHRSAVICTRPFRPGTASG